MHAPAWPLTGLICNMGVIRERYTDKCSCEGVQETVKVCQKLWTCVSRQGGVRAVMEVCKQKRGCVSGDGGV